MAIDFTKYQVGGAKTTTSTKQNPTTTGIDFSKYQVKTPVQTTQQIQQPQKSLVSKAGEFIGKIGKKIFDSDEDLLQSRTNDLIQRMNLYKQQGKDTKGIQTDLKIVAKAQDPNTSPAQRLLATQYTRIARTGDQLTGGFGRFIAGNFDTLTMASEHQDTDKQNTIKEINRQLERQIASSTDQNKILVWKKQIDKNNQELNKTPEPKKTREVSQKINKWADELETKNPNFSDKLASGASSMAGFALVTYLTGGGGTIPYLIESTSEASNTYEELRKRGLSVEDASSKANGVLLGNLIFNKVFNIFDDLGGAKTVKSILIGTGKEGIQEGYQQVFQNLALDNDWSMGVVESALIGGILGGTTSVVFPGQIETTETTKIDPEQILEKTVSSKIAKTETGKQLIKTAIEAKEQGKQVVLAKDGSKVAVAVDKEVVTKPTEKTKPISGVTEALPQEKIAEKTLFRGSKGKVVSETKTFDKVLTVENNQADLIKQLADEGNVKAKELYDSLPNKQRVDFTIADPIIREAFKDQYDAIQYKNQQAKQIGAEYHDLASNKFYAENEATAKLYAQQKRVGKYEGKEVKKTGEQTLVEEAKKYKSAEDFGKSLEPIYHGGSGVEELTKKFRIASPEEKLKFATSGGGFEGLSLTTDKNIAKQYSQAIGNSDNILEVYKNPQAKIYQIDTKGNGIDEVVDLQKIKSEGFDAVQDISSNSEKEYRALTENAVITKSQLTDIYNQAHKTEIKQEVKKVIKTEEKPKVKASKVAVSIEQKLNQKFENLAGFESVNIKEQNARVEELINKDLNKVKDIVSGKKSLPSGIRGSALIKGVEEYAIKTGNIDLLRSLAISPLVSETSIHAQELRLLAERDENSVLTKIQDLANERAKIVEKKYKEKADKLIKKEVSKIKSETKVTSREQWQSFIKSIEC